MPSPTSDSSTADRVDAILSACFELPATEWEASLARACDEHPDLATRLRRRAEILRGAGLFESVVDGAASRERIGPYQLLRPLGVGGMGVVYVARHQDQDREVALKLLRDQQLLFPSARARFEREVATIGQLKHQNIVTVLDASSHGVPYIAMELLHGMSLDALLAQLGRTRVEQLSGADALAVLASRGPLSPAAGELCAGTWQEVCLRVAAQVADGLAYAHDRGVIHRDLKPSNVMLTFDGRVVLLDFGLALRVGETKLTRSGAQLGSLPYMAPEQVRGAATDQRTDVYGLGVTLYEMLTLSAPYWSERTESLMRAILEGSAVRVRQRNRAIAREVDTICHVAIDPAPVRRYARMQLMAEDFRAALAGASIRARPSGVIHRTLRYCRRRPRTAAAIVALAVLMVAVPTAVNIATAAQRDRALELGYAALIAAASEDLRTGSVLAARDKLARCPEYLRGFEWRLLARRHDASSTRFAGHERNMGWVRWAAADRLVITLSFDGGLRAWDPDSGARIWLRELPPHRHAEFDVDPTGRIIAIAIAGERQVRLHDSESGEPRPSVPVSEDVRHLRFDPSGRLWADDRAAIIEIDLERGNVAGRTSLPRALRALQPLAGGRFVGIEREDVYVVDPAAGSIVRLVDGTGAYVVAAGAEDRVAIGTKDGRIHLYESGSAAIARTMAGHQRRAIYSLAFAPDGATLFSGGEDGTIHVWNARTGALRNVLVGHESTVHSVACSSDGKRLASTTAHHAARVWDPDASPARRMLRGVGSQINSMVWSHDGTRICACTYGGTLLAWDTDSGAIAWRGEHGTVVGQSRDGRSLAAASKSSLRLLDVRTGAVRWEAPWSGLPWTIAFSPDNAWVAVGGEPASVHVYAVADPSKRREIARGAGPIRAMTFDHEGRMWVDQHQNVVAYDFATAQQVHRLDSLGNVNLLRLAPDRNRLYCSEEYQIAVIDLASLRRSVWMGHRSAVRGLDPAPDGARIATGSTDGTVRLWHAATGVALITLDHLDDWIYQVAFAPDGNRLAAAGENGDITIWDAGAPGVGR